MWFVRTEPIIVANLVGFFVSVNSGIPFPESNRNQCNSICTG